MRPNKRDEAAKRLADDSEMTYEAAVQMLDWLIRDLEIEGRRAPVATGEYLPVHQDTRCARCGGLMRAAEHDYEFRARDDERAFCSSTCAQRQWKREHHE